MKRVLVLFVGVLAFASALCADSPPRSLTLAEALQLFRSGNPSLHAAQLHLEAIQAAEVTAGLRVNPLFTSANQDFPVFNPSQFDLNTQEFTDSLAWTFERGGKRRARVESARAATVVGRDSLADARRQLEFQLKTTFIGALLAKSTLTLAEDNLREYRQVIEANRLRLQAGDISETEFDRIVVEEARFQTDLLNAQAALAQSRSALSALLGFAEPNAVEAQGALTAPEFTSSLQQLQEIALRGRPDYIAAKDSQVKAAADVKLARANGATDVVVAPEYKRNGPENTLGVTFQVPLRIFDRNQGEKLRSARELEASRFAEVAARQQVIADVAQAWQAYQAASARAQLYSHEYLQRAKNVRDRMQFSYEHGAANLLDYLDAVRSYRDVELAAIGANAQVLSAIHQLSFATGTELLP